jgi:hypothetical protein
MGSDRKLFIPCELTDLHVTACGKIVLEYYRSGFSHLRTSGLIRALTDKCGVLLFVLDSLLDRAALPMFVPFHYHSPIITYDPCHFATCLTPLSLNF